MMRRPISLAALALLFTVLPVSAQQHDMGSARDRLNLTAEQKTAVRTIRMETARQMIDLRAALQKKRLDVAEAMQSDTPDRAKVERLFADISDVQLKQKMLRFDADQKIQKQLTPEQRTIWKELKQERHQQMRGRFAGKFRPHRDGWDRGPGGRRMQDVPQGNDR